MNLSLMGVPGGKGYWLENGCWLAEPPPLRGWSHIFLSNALNGSPGLAFCIFEILTKHSSCHVSTPVSSLAIVMTLSAEDHCADGLNTPSSAIAPPKCKILSIWRIQLWEGPAPSGVSTTLPPKPRTPSHMAEMWRIQL